VKFSDQSEIHKPPNQNFGKYQHSPVVV